MKRPIWCRSDNHLDLEYIRADNKLPEGVYDRQ